MCIRDSPYTQDNRAHVCSDTCASTQAHIRPSVHAYTRAHTCTRTGEKFAAPCAHPKMHTALCRASGGRFGALKVSASGSYPPPAICAPRTARWPSLHLANRVRASSICSGSRIRTLYAKYELAYPCGNDANTGRCCRYNSILPLEKKIVWRHPPGTKGASGCRTRNQDTQVHI